MKIYLYFLMVVTLSLSVFAPTEIWAKKDKNDGPLSIAIVDVEQLLTDSKAAKSIQKKLNNKKEEFQKEFSAHEKELRTKEKELIDMRNSLSAEEFKEKRTAFEEKLLETRKLFQQRRSTLDQALGKAMADLRKEILQVTAKISDERGYQVVFSRENVVIVEKSMDITKDVMSALNKAIQDIDLEIPKEK